MAEKTPTSKLPAFIDHRINPRNDAMSALFDSVRELSNEFIEIKTRLEIHSTIAEEQRHEIIDKMNNMSAKIDEALDLKDAFIHVDGKPDTAGHKSDHLTRIQSAESSNKFWDKVKEEAASKVVSAVLIACIVIFGIGLKDWLAQYMKNPAATAQQLVPSEEK